MWEFSKDYHTRNTTMESYSWQGLAIKAQQEASKYMLVGLLEDANLCVIHMKCITILHRDLQLALCIWGKPSIRWKTGGHIESEAWCNIQI